MMKFCRAVCIVKSGHASSEVNNKLSPKFQNAISNVSEWEFAESKPLKAQNSSTLQQNDRIISTNAFSSTFQWRHETFLAEKTFNNQIARCSSNTLGCLQNPFESFECMANLICYLTLFMPFSSLTALHNMYELSNLLFIIRTENPSEQPFVMHESMLIGWNKNWNISFSCLHGQRSDHAICWAGGVICAESRRAKAFNNQVKKSKILLASMNFLWKAIWCEGKSFYTSQ